MDLSGRTLDILILDGDPLVLRSLTRQLQAEAGFRVTGSALDADQAVASLAEQPAGVAIVDPWLSGAAGPEVVHRIHHQFPLTAILVLSRGGDTDRALEVLRAGASGFLSKESSADVLPRAVRAIARGEAVVPRTVTASLIVLLRALPEPGSGLRPVRSVLTSREWEVLDMLVAGSSTQEIATDLELTTETVRSHVKRILRKLHAHSRAEAIDRARELIRYGETPAHSSS